MPEPFQRTIFVLRQQITIALLAVVFVGTTTSHSLAQDSPSAVMPSKHRAVLKKYCFECHSENSKEGGVDLENLGLDLGTQMAAEHWQKVLNVLNSGEMPPEDEPQLNASEKRSYSKTSLTGLLLPAKYSATQAASLP